MAEAYALTSFEGFLDQQFGADQRSELVGGRVFAMAGGTERHDLLAGLLYEALASGARKAGCRPFAGNRLVRVGGESAYYPDVVVVCGSAANPLFEVDAAVVVEVLSPSTERTDRREKWEAYRRLAGLRHYVLADPNRRELEVYSRDPESETFRWRSFGVGQWVELDYGMVVVDGIYDTLDGAATT